MKRDMELIRKILFAAEEFPSGRGGELPNIEIEGYSEAEVGYHTYLIGDAGLAKTYDCSTSHSHAILHCISMLTSKGHDFIDATRSEEVWTETKRAVAQAGGGVTLAIIAEVASAYIRHKLGLN